MGCSWTPRAAGPARADWENVNVPVESPIRWCCGSHHGNGTAERVVEKDETVAASGNPSGIFCTLEWGFTFKYSALKA